MTITVIMMVTTMKSYDNDISKEQSMMLLIMMVQPFNAETQCELKLEKYHGNMEDEL